jgi:Ca-activated chloride channel family protein
MIATVPLVESMFEPELPAMVGPQPKGPEPILAPPIDWDLSKKQLALLRDVAEAKWGKFLAHQLVNEDTEIPQQIDGPRPGGLEPIFARGYDARVHAKYGVHPFVSAQTFKHFRSSRPPLVSSTLSYERARRDVLAGRRIDSNAVRIEEFLAAPDYALPMASRGEARLHMAGGKSPFAGRTQLVQVSLNVGDKLPRQRPPVHLVVAVDVSTSMSNTGRIDNVRKALGRLVDQMEPDDRISVIAFNEEANVLAEQLQRRDRRHLLDIIRSMEAAGATNLGAALQLAYSVAQTSVPASTTNKPFDRRVVVIGDGHTGMTPDAQFRIASLLTTAAREGISVQLVDHSVRTSPSAAMMAIAQASGCSALAAATPQELDWALDRWLTGDEPVVLTDAVLDVQFNPAVVTRYRLIGHGSQLRPGAAATNLRAGQVATVLYEVETIPNANGWVARTHVAWRDSASSKSRRTPTASLAKKELDTRFADTATSFQLAVVAAQMGEALKRSPYLKVSTKQAIRQAEQAAAQIDTHARNLPQNKRLLNFLKQLRRVRSW